jgi:hypothetical protein
MVSVSNIHDDLDTVEDVDEFYTPQGVDNTPGVARDERSLEHDTLLEVNRCDQCMH